MPTLKQVMEEDARRTTERNTRAKQITDALTIIGKAIRAPGRGSAGFNWYFPCEEDKENTKVFLRFTNSMGQNVEVYYFDRGPYGPSLKLQEDNPDHWEYFDEFFADVSLE